MYVSGQRKGDVGLKRREDMERMMRSREEDGERGVWGTIWPNGFI